MATRHGEVHDKSWAILVDQQDGLRVLGHIVLTVRIWPADGQFAAECLQLGVPGCGTTVEEAAESAFAVSIEYLNALEHAGERDRIFAEHNLSLVPGFPQEDPDGEEVRIPVQDNSYFKPQPVALLDVG